MPLGFRFRNLGRLRQIISVLVFEYGLGSLFDQFDLGRFLPLGRRRRLAPEYEAMSSARRLRLALSRLGPSFIKLGQILSARPDLLPPDMISELRQLQDQGPTVPFEQVRGVIEAELGQPLERLFASFSEKPLSSASLGQVHTATLHDGQQVTVKVLRPGVEELVRADVQVFRDVALLLDRQVPALRPYDLPGFVRQFEDQLEAELSYTVEAYNMERARRALEGSSSPIFIPEVIWSRTARRVLTTERIYGRRVDDPTPSAPVDRPRLAREFGEFVLREIFVDGFFHGDPHQGNVLVTDDGRIALLDWGIVGYLDPKTRRLLAEVLSAMNRKNVDAAVSATLEIGSPRLDTDLVSFRHALSRVVIRAEILPPKEFTVGQLLFDTIRAMAQQQIRVPMELSLAARALVVGEAVCTDLDPGFDFREAAQPVMDEERRRLSSPEAIFARAEQFMQAFGRQLLRLPGRMDTILSLLERGSLRVNVEDRDADRRIQELARSFNRLALSLLSAALLIAGTLYTLLSHHPTHSGIGWALGVTGVVLGAFVAFAVLRWRRI